MKNIKNKIPTIDIIKQTGFFVAVGTIVYILTFLTHSPDPDLWARLAVGSIFFQTGKVPVHDIFSYVPTKTLWIDHEWGSSVIFYGFTKFAGTWGIFLLKAVLLFAIFLFIIRTIKTVSNRNSGILYLIFIGFALFPGVGSVIRCQMFTYFFFTIWLYLLENIRQNKRIALWIFPATMLLWVNLHGGFTAGIGLIAIYCVGELLNRKNPLRYVAILAMILPVTLINPYGINFWHYMIQATTMARPLIPEWHPVNLNGPNQMILGFKVHYLAGFLIIALLTIIAIIKQFIKKEKPDWTKLLTTATLLYLALSHQRHTTLFVLSSAIFFYSQYIDMFKPIFTYFTKLFNNQNQKILTTTKSSFGYILLVIIVISITPLLSYQLLLNPKEYPFGSFEFIRQNNLSGNLATTFTWSSFAFWKLSPQCKVLIDGRYEEVYEDSVFNEAMDLSSKSGRWFDLLSKYHTDILVLPKRLYSPADLKMIPTWDLAYQDFISVVLLPKEKLNQKYIQPDYKNRFYLKEDFSKVIKITEK